MFKPNPISEDAQRLNAVISTATDGIIIINHRGLIEMVNPAAATLFGYREQEMIGHGDEGKSTPKHMVQHHTKKEQQSRCVMKKENETNGTVN